jgi:hypothetical protein
MEIHSDEYALRVDAYPFSAFISHDVDLYAARLGTSGCGAFLFTIRRVKYFANGYNGRGSRQDFIPHGDEVRRVR